MIRPDMLALKLRRNRAPRPTVTREAGATTSTFHTNPRGDDGLMGGDAEGAV